MNDPAKPGRSGERRWMIYVCAECDAARFIKRPAPWNAWCDGACSHPKTDMQPVEVIPSIGEGREPRLQEIVCRFVSLINSMAYVGGPTTVNEVVEAADAITKDHWSEIDRALTARRTA